MLLKARARLYNGLGPTMTSAATNDNADGIRILCAAGATPLEENIFGCWASIDMRISFHSLFCFEGKIPVSSLYTDMV